MLGQKPHLAKPSRCDLTFACLSFLIYILMLLTTDQRHLEFGDGNYLYIAWRFANGAALYKDMLVPQPPLLFVVGAALTLAGGQLQLFRLFNIVLTILTGVVVYKTSAMIFRSAAVGLTSGVIYHVLPIHLYWGRGFEADPLMSVFLVLTLYLLVRGEKRNLVIASLTSLCASLTKFTFLPVLAFILFYFSVVDRRGIRHFALLAVVWHSIAFLALHICSEGWFTWSVLVAQSRAPYYDSSTVEIFLDGIQLILFREGGLLAMAFLGGLMATKKAENRHDLLFGVTLASCLQIVLTLRQGTYFYLFTSVEPFVAILSGYALVRLVQNYATWESRVQARQPSLAQVRSLALIALMMGSLLFVPMRILLFDQFLNFRLINNWSNAYTVQMVAQQIERYTTDKDEILSPPYFAFLTHRKLVNDFSETWLWLVNYRSGDQKATIMIDSIVRRTNEKSVNIVIMDWRMQQISPLSKSVSANYVLIARFELGGLEGVSVYVPLGSQVVPGSFR